MKRAQGKNSVFVCLVLLIVISGCGLKANPQAMRSLPDYRLIVKDMQAISSDEAVILKWNFQDMDGKINYIINEQGLEDAFICLKEQ